jgi:tol-pal system protein YbgF
MVARFAPLLALLLPLAAAAQAPAPLDARLARIERLIDSGVLIDLANRLDQLQADVRDLRGAVELQGRDVDVLKQRQRDLYRDIDRRLRKLEVGGAVPPAAALPQETPASTPPDAAPAVAPVASSPPAAPAPAPEDSPPAADPAVVQQAYQAAFDLLKEGRYAEAIAAFEKFLASYPGGLYTDNAQYWLGEANYVTRNFPVAVREFRKVLDEHPGSSKVPDAMLKLGYAHYELQAWAEAREILTTLRNQHSGSTAARLAASRLQRMAQEGR